METLHSPDEEHVPASGGRQVARTIDLGRVGDAAFVYVEMIRANLPRGQDTFARVDALGRSLRDVRGYAFAGVARTDEERPLTPSWVDAVDYAVAGDASTVAVAASLAHASFDLPDAFDLGARDGRNSFDWGEDGWGNRSRGLCWPWKQLFVGQIGAGWLEMTEVGGDVRSVDVTRDGRKVAILEEWRGATTKYAICLVEAASGVRSVLTAIDYAAVSIRFSPDEAWLLLDTGGPPTLIEVATGRSLRVPRISGYTSWWPARSASSLLVLDDANHGVPTLTSFDLGTNESQELGSVDLPNNSTLVDLRRWLHGLQVSADGKHALCLSHFGVPAEHQDRFGSTQRVSVIDLESRRLTTVLDAFVDREGILEREQHGPRWVQRPAPGEVDICSELLGQLAAPETRPIGGTDISGHLSDIVSYGMRTMLGDTPAGSRPHHLRAEVLRAFAALWEYDTEREWLPKLEPDRFAPMLVPPARAGALPPEIADGWLKFFRAWEKIKRGHARAVDWASDRYLAAPFEPSRY